MGLNVGYWWWGLRYTGAADRRMSFILSLIIGPLLPSPCGSARFGSAPLDSAMELAWSHLLGRLLLRDPCS